jgi:two-component system cell cycle sensor histidine kinase/response regulator CckA
MAAIGVLLRRLLPRAKLLTQQRDLMEAQGVELKLQMEELETSNQQLQSSIIEVEEARQIAQQALLERDASVALLDASLSCAPLGFAFVDRNLRYVRANQPFADFVGLTIEDVTGMAIGEVPADSARTMAAHIANVLASGTPLLGIDVAARSSGTGTSRNWLASFYPILGSNGEITHAGVVAEDITERRMLEDQFRQSQKMEAVGRLAAGVAHDFNNLLTIIKASSDLLMLDLETSDPRRAEAEEISLATDRAAVLTRQLLAFGRKQVLSPRVLNLNEVVNGIERMLRRVTGDIIELQLVLRSDIGNITADPGQLEQVMMNLALNGVDAMRSGGRLTIETANVYLDDGYARTHTGVEAGRYVALVVSDTGSGMDRDTLSHIFEPFFTTKPPGKGTGLGLATVYGIVTQSRGHLWVYSEPEFGTTFKVYLPRVAAEVTNAVQMQASGSRHAGYETLLLVEDDPDVRASVRRMLERQGYKVIEAEDGVDAVRVATAHTGDIDLVITDLMMPRLSGRELMGLLNASHPDTPVLFMSGYTDDEVVRRGLLDSHHEFIQKPFSLDDLVRAVQHMLQSTKQKIAAEG